MRKPTIGTPRIYVGDEIPLIYPGECAYARISPADVQAAIAAGRTEVAIRDWLVEPAPGWRGWYMRARWRVWGRWFATGAPRLETTITTGPADE